MIPGRLFYLPVLIGMGKEAWKRRAFKMIHALIGDAEQIDGTMTFLCAKRVHIIDTNYEVSDVMIWE